MINLVFRISGKNGQLALSSTEGCTTHNPAIDEALLDKLSLAVRASASKEYGFFSEEAMTPFHKILKAYCINGDSIDGLRAELTTSLSECFASSDIEWEQDYFLWIMQSSKDQHLPIGIFLLNHDASFFFTDQLDLSENYCIDTSKLKYAAVIDPLEWQQDNQRYVTLLAPRTPNPINNAFQKLIKLTVGIDRKADAEQFLQVINRYANEKIPSDKKEVTSRVFKYCTELDKKGRPVNIQKLSEYMDQQAPEAFAKYVSANLDTPPTDWHPDRRQVQKHSKFFGRDGNLSISFSSMMFGDDIVYDERTNSLTIKSLPKSLVRQIERYLRKSV